MSNDFDERIKKARENNMTDLSHEETIEGDDGTESSGSRAGSEFLASVIAGAFIGYGIDWMFSTKPWGMLFFIVIGFISAVIRANAAMKKNNNKNE